MRRYTYLFTVLLVALSFNCYSQRTCAADEYHKQQMQDPTFAKNFIKQKKLVYERLTENTNRIAGGLQIPVAVHYNSPIDASNTQCLIDAAQAQIDQFNLDFSACNMNAGLFCDWINAGCTQFGPADAMPANGSGIQFYLADQNLPAGEDNIGGFAITVGDYTWSTATATWAGYMNIFVSDGATAGVGGGILGVAPLNGAANPNGNGFYVLHTAFGGQGFASCSSGGALDGGAPFDGGATATHEAGHYFGLEHSWADALADTPVQPGSNFGCPSVDPTTCTCVGDCDGYAGNFMDYVDDDCMFMFTDDQVNLMCATAAPQASWAINSISSTTPYMACNGVCAFVADFEPIDGANITLCLDNSGDIQFTDLSSVGASSWMWTITQTSGDLVFSPTTSTAQNPIITITGGSTGIIEVTLVSSDGIETDMISQSYSVNALSGAACPTGCDFTLNLLDDFGDGWNGATLEIFEDGNSVGVFGGGFTAGSTDGPYTVTLNDGTNVDFVQTNGGFPDEEGWTITYPGGCPLASMTDGLPISQTITVNCAEPTCSDGIMNCFETDIDCGGPDCMDCPVCGSVFYDNGGMTGNYMNSANETFTLCPDDPACELISVEFTFVDIESSTGGGSQDGCWDFLTIYDGGSTASPVIAATLCGEESGDGGVPSVGSSLLEVGDVFTSTDISGCLTFTFQSDGTVSEAGWAADVTCVDNTLCVCPDLTAAAPIAVITTESACAVGCVVSGGQIDPPTTPCPTDSSLEYSVDGGLTWTTVLPIYNAALPITVSTRCLCDLDLLTTSPISSITTIPGTCNMPADPTLTITDNVCPALTGTIMGSGAGGIITYYATLADATASLNGTTTAPIYPAFPNIITVCITETDANGCVSNPICSDTAPIDCSGPILTYDTSLSDPCDCNDDQSANGAMDGTFSETVVFNTVPPTPGLSLCIANGSTGIASGTPFVDAGDGSYSVTFNHVDGIGYALSVADCVDLDAVIAGPINNICNYPVIELITSIFCLDDPLVDLSAMAMETTGGAFSGVFSFSGQGVIGNQFDPAAAGVGTHAVTIDYMPTTIDGTNPGTVASCNTQIIIMVEVLDCEDCTGENGGPEIQSIPGNNE